MESTAHKPTLHKLHIGDCRQVMPELADNSIHLIITSPAYFCAPHDYKGLFATYGDYLDLSVPLRGKGTGFLLQAVSLR